MIFLIGNVASRDSKSATYFLELLSSRTFFRGGRPKSSALLPRSAKARSDYGHATIRTSRSSRNPRCFKKVAALENGVNRSISAQLSPLSVFDIKVAEDFKRSGNSFFNVSELSK